MRKYRLSETVPADLRRKPAKMEKESHNYIYIVECADGTWYTGWTTDLEKRVKTHNSGKGAKYTRCRLPVRLIYYEELGTQVEAQRREYAVKRLTRAQKEALVREKKEAEGKL